MPAIFSTSIRSKTSDREHAIAFTAVPEGLQASDSANQCTSSNEAFAVDERGGSCSDFRPSDLAVRGPILLILYCQLTGAGHLVDVSIDF